MNPTDSLPTFDRLFPSFVDQCQTLYTMLIPIAVVLIVCGLIADVRQSGSQNNLLYPIVMAATLAMALAFWGDWIDVAQRAMRSVVAEINADPIGTAQRYVDVLVSKEDPKQKAGWFGLPSGAQMYEAVLWGFLSLIGIFAHFLIWAAYILQRFLLGLGYAFAPVFLGFLALRSTVNIGVRYIMGIVGIISWPLGWAAASIGTSSLIDVATEQGLIVMTNVYGLQTIMAGAIIGAWIILTTLIAPVVIQYAIASGAQVGSALLGGALTAGAAAVSTGATTAATLGTSGVGKAGMVAGGSASAAGSLAGASMQGGGPPLNGSTISHLARPWWSMPKSSAGGSSGSTTASENDTASGGESAPSATPQAGTPGFNPNDPANSRQADEALERSRRTQ